jgi:hypothetical protein
MFTSIILTCSYKYVHIYYFLQETLPRYFFHKNPRTFPNIFAFNNNYTYIMFICVFYMHILYLMFIKEGTYKAPIHV